MDDLSIPQSEIAIKAHEILIDEGIDPKEAIESFYEAVPPVETGG
jgi:hypothetical protein